MARVALLLLAAAVLVAGVCADETASPAHKGGKGKGKDQYYYNLAVQMTVETYDRYAPIPNSFALVTAAFTGDVLVAGNQVGSYQAIGTSTNNIAAPGAPLSILTNMVIEMGADTDDTLTVAGVFEVNSGTFAFADVDLAITGGTGRFLGATGEVVIGSGGLLTATTFPATLHVFVPRLYKK